MIPGVRALCVALCLTPIAALLVACQPKAPTVSYYRAHAEERRARVAQCADDPASARDDASCINALAAEREKGIGSFRKLPPLHLPPPNSNGRPPAP
ncbi:MAG TPA: EexN family lipoprotein [Polyangiaceae bacterium]|nr:EexN family lipoprotein [Polyangiaceae bacterium]